MASFSGFLLLGRAFLSEFSSRFWCKAIAVLVLAMLADHLFLGPLGLAAGSTLGIFGLVLLLFVWILRVPQPEALDYVLGTASLGLCLALLYDPGFLAAHLLWCMLAMLVLRRTFARPGDARDIVLRLTALTFSASIRPFKDLGLLSRAGKRRPRPAFRLTPFILPLAALILFGALLVWANPILEDMAGRIDATALFEVLSFERLFIWALTGIIAWSLMRSVALYLPQPAADAPAEADSRLARFFSVASVLAALLLCNAIFALQNGLDITYLWAGENLPSGMTHAQYAHRGAYPLILTALLAGAFVLIALRHGSPTEHHAGVKVLVYLWLAQNVFLVASAILRTLNYVEDYSLTLLRLSALIWMGLVALGLVLIVLRIVYGKSGRWLINANALAAFGVLSAAAFVNFSALVADYNVRHSRDVGGRGQFLDMSYLAELGPAALPSFDWFITRLRDAPHAGTAMQYRTELYAKLALRQQDWRLWTWANERLLASVPPPPAADPPRRWRAP
jgi:hypothetical protein